MAASTRAIARILRFAFFSALLLETSGAGSAAQSSSSDPAKSPHRAGSSDPHATTSRPRDKHDTAPDNREAKTARRKEDTAENTAVAPRPIKGKPPSASNHKASEDEQIIKNLDFLLLLELLKDYRVFSDRD